MPELSRATYHHGDLRQALIEAGLELTRAGGPDALALRDVTRRVGVSPSAAYRHFADRDALLAAVATRIQDDMAQRMRSFQASAPDATGRLRAVGLGYIAFALARAGLVRGGVLHHRGAAGQRRCRPAAGTAGRAGDRPGCARRRGRAARR
ncbi:TetR/AcrR family transcriptional regulator [Microbacterium elymi]|uniref:TetR/AcrR family transcriptional regulator n=1 Tax=Microbacterium elymi TaxID=2909587 RepID=UPI00338E5608